MIALVWAMDENRLIGKGDKLPWHIEEDLKLFKSITEGKVVLMGNRTYESMKGYYKNKPFPFNKVYVANLKNKNYEDAIRINNVEEFLSTFRGELYVIGGASIYELALPYADKLYISHIKGKYEGDSYFPEFDLTRFELIEQRKTEKLTFAKYVKVMEV